MMQQYDREGYLVPSYMNLSECCPSRLAPGILHAMYHIIMQSCMPVLCLQLITKKYTSVSRDRMLCTVAYAPTVLTDGFVLWITIEGCSRIFATSFPPYLTLIPH